MATFGSTFGDVLAPQISTIASDVAPKAVLQVFGESSAYGAGFQVVREGWEVRAPPLPPPFWPGPGRDIGRGR